MSCDKAIYGTVIAVLLSYKKLIGHLLEWGFKMNPYKPNCWNKMIDGEQFTTVFYIDDPKLSHKIVKQVSDMIAMLESIYAAVDPMTVYRG